MGDEAFGGLGSLRGLPGGRFGGLEKVILRVRDVKKVIFRVGGVKKVILRGLGRSWEVVWRGFLRVPEGVPKGGGPKKVLKLPSKPILLGRGLEGG